MRTISVRVYEKDAARHRRLVQTVRFREWGSVALYLNTFSGIGGVLRYYEVEEYNGDPGDTDGE